MDISKVAGINNVVDNSKKVESGAKSILPKELTKEDKEKVALALTGLATVGIATIAIKKFTGKSVSQIAKNAYNSVKNGESATKVKKEATKNLQKTDKKIVKDAIKAGHSERLAQEAAQRQVRTQNMYAAKRAPGVINGMAQGGKKASEETLQANLQQMKNYADGVAQNAAKARESLKQAEKAGKATRSARKSAQYLTNQAAEANKKVLRAESKYNKIIEERRTQVIKKAANKQALQASPNYQAGVEKMKINQTKTQQAAIVRNAKRDISKPAYQRQMSTLQAHFDAGRVDTAEKLAKKALNSSKDAERKAAEDFLAVMFK